MRAPGPSAAVLIVAVAAAAPYLRTFDVPWVLDDFPVIVEEPSVHAADLSTRALAPAVAGFPLQRWLPRLTFAVNHALGGLAPAGWHAVNLAVHALAALLAFAFAAEVLARADPGLDPERRRRAALLCAMLFAVHPLQTMAVTYVVQRMAALSALFCLAALVAWARAGRAGGWRRLAWLGAAAVAAFLAISSKESAAVLPLLVLAYEGLVVGQLGARLRRHAVPAAAGAAVVAAGLAAVALAYRGQYRSEATVSALPLAERLLTQPRVIALYLGRFLLPWPGWLHVDHGLAPSRGLLDPPATVAALLLVAGLAAASAALRRRAPAAAFGIAFFLLALAVEQSVVPLDFVMEHRMYLPLAGLALGAGWGLERAVGARRPGPWPVAAPLLLLLAAGTAARNEAWRDPVRLHGQDAAASPAPARPLLNLGAALYERGDLPAAEAALRRLVELDPGEARAWSNLAQIALARGDPLAAVELARRGLAVDPGCGPCRHNHAAALLAAGLEEEALAAFREAARLAPGNAPARRQVGVILLRRGDVEGALAELRQAVALDPGAAIGWAGLSTALGVAGRREEALAAARRAVALDPALPAGREALQRALGP